MGRWWDTWHCTPDRRPVWSPWPPPSLQIPAPRCGVVARLLVAPEQRGTGLGHRLLDHATEQCRQRGLTPILDVVEGNQAAIALYERVGWRHLGMVSFTLPDGSELREHVYAAPDPGGA